MADSKETLKKKALFLLGLKAKQDTRYMEFCLKMMFRTGVSMQRVEDKIIQYSKGNIK